MAEEGIKKLSKREKKALLHRSGVGASQKRSVKKARKELRRNNEAVPEEDLQSEEPTAGNDSQPSSSTAVNSVNDAKTLSKSKKRKASDLEPDAAEEDGAAPKKTAKSTRARFICFCGNLPYDVTADDIKLHFAQACGQTPSVRLLTPRSKPEEDTSKTKPSKGCAFIEFTNAGALQSALRLHHSLMSKRKINVEISAGGGGKGETRTGKIVDARKRLTEQRARKLKEKHEKAVKEAKAKGEKVPELEVEGEVVKKLRPMKQLKKGARPAAPPPKPSLSGANAIRLG